MVALKMPKYGVAVTLTLSEVSLKGVMRFGSLQDAVSVHALEPFDSGVVDFVSGFFTSFVEVGSSQENARCGFSCILVSSFKS